MGFRQPDLSDAWAAIRKCLVEIQSPYNDGFTASYCKHELFKLKSWLEEQYHDLPHFADEDKWEAQQTFDRLKKKNT